MNKELNEDARTKQDLLYECSSLESKLSNEIIKNEHLEQQCKKQKEVIDKLNNHIEDRISILQVKIRHNEKDKYYEGKLIGACKELDMLKSLLKEVSE